MTDYLIKFKDCNGVGELQITHDTPEKAIDYVKTHLNAIKIISVKELVNIKLEHKCVFMTKNQIEIEYKNNDWVLIMNGVFFVVYYCPFCGEKL